MDSPQRSGAALPPLSGNEGKTTKASENRKIRKKKLEKIRMESNATTIQALYRGRKARVELQQKSVEPTVLPLSSTPSSALNSVEKNETEPCPIQTQIEESPSPAQSQADHENDLKSAPSELPPQEQSPSPEWPAATHDHFNELEDLGSWPELHSSDDHGQRSWVIKNKKILLRTITWNMCANRPPPVQHVQRSLLPLNRSVAAASIFTLFAGP
jgi:hypothetical protein